MQSLFKYLQAFPAKYELLDTWFLMKSPIPIITIWILYLLFVLKVGPAFMKNREPFKLRKFLILYNLFQVWFSLYQFSLAYEILRPLNIVGISCNDDEEGINKLLWFGYVYILSKLSELMDTILFVLRKKQNQVSFLHVYHHSVLIVGAYYVMKIEPVNAIVYLVLINSLVHVIMYSYYCLSAFPALTPYLWWKKYITAIQVMQFVSVIIHAVGNYIYSDCAPSYILLTIILFNEVVFIYLFGEFFVNSYIKPKRKPKTEEKAN